MGNKPLFNLLTTPSSTAILLPLLPSAPFSSWPVSNGTPHYSSTSCLPKDTLNLLLTLPWPCLGPLTTWFLCGMMFLTALSLKFSLSLRRQTHPIPVFSFCLIMRTQFCLGWQSTHLNLHSSVSLPPKGSHVTQFSSVNCRWEFLVEILDKLLKRGWPSQHQQFARHSSHLRQGPLHARSNRGRGLPGHRPRFMA